MGEGFEDLMIVLLPSQIPHGYKPVASVEMLSWRVAFFEKTVIDKVV